MGDAKTWFCLTVAIAFFSGMTHGCESKEDTPADAVRPDGSQPDAKAPADAARPGITGSDANVPPVDASSLDAPGLDSKVPPEVLAAADEWPLANRNYAGTRATKDSRISSKNVASLHEAWSFELPIGGTYGAAVSNPLVLEGVVYFVDSQNNVFALDSQTGAVRWQRRYDAAGAIPNGIAIGWGKLFTSAGDSAFVALDLETGRELWSATIDVPRYAGIGIAPIPYDGLVFLSTVPVNSGSQYGGNVNGTLYALDQASGEVRWSFKTVKDEDLWGNPTLNSGGGAWYPPTIDFERSTMYWGTGNPAPYPGAPGEPQGQSRPGDNLYTNSVLALGVREGTLSWYHQEKPHDLFDLDFQNSPVLFDTKIEGERRSLVVGSGKTGTVVALDADRDGELVWRTPVGKHENEHAQSIPSDGIVIFPGTFGGVLTPLAYADDTIYAATANWGTRYAPESFVEFEGMGTGEITALHASDGAALWTTALPTPPFGAMTVVNDLVFGSMLTGQVFAIERATGSIVWMHQAPLGVNAPLTISGDLLLVAAGYGVGTPKLVALGLDVEGDPKVVKPEAAAPEPIGKRAEKLSDTGLYADIAQHQLAEGVRAFAPKGTLWSDGADKQRWVYLPKDTKIDSSNMDGWVFPVGTKFWKEFSIDGKRIETRLLEKQSGEHWRTLAFLWDDDEREARAVPKGYANAHGTQHDVPNQSFCMRCHGSVSDIALGFSAVQLAEGTELTTAMLAQSGLLTDAPTASLQVPGDDVARSALYYLSANCSGCHNPRTYITNATSVDFSLPIASLSAIETTSAYLTVQRDLTQSGGLDQSAVLLRMGSRGIQGQMPPIASEVVDERGLAGVRAWLSTIELPPAQQP